MTVRTDASRIGLGRNDTTDGTVGVASSVAMRSLLESVAMYRRRHGDVPGKKVARGRRARQVMAVDFATRPLQLR